MEYGGVSGGASDGDEKEATGGRQILIHCQPCITSPFLGRHGLCMLTRQRASRSLSFGGPFLCGFIGYAGDANCACDQI